MAQSIRPDYAHLLFLLKRKEGLTWEQFSNYWHETHAKLFVSLEIVKSNILAYEQASPSKSN